MRAIGKEPKSKDRKGSHSITICKTNVRRWELVPRPTVHGGDPKGNKTWTKLSLFEEALGGPIFLTEALRGDFHDFVITKSQTGHFMMHIPHRVPCVSMIDPVKDRRVASVDPGGRTLWHAYVPGACEIAMGLQNCGKRLKISLAFQRGEIGLAIVREKKMQLPIGERQLNLDWLRLRETKRMSCLAFERARNLIHYMHFECIRKIFSVADTVLIPPLSVAHMVQKGKGRKLQTPAVKQLLQCAHYKIRQKLIASAVTHGKEVVVVSEEYTTQTCGKCGVRNTDVGAKKLFKCTVSSCGFQCDRDSNGARNIVLKYVG